MFVGKVVGTVWSSVKWPGVSGHKLLLVRPYHLADLLVHPLNKPVSTSAVECQGPAKSVQTHPGLSNTSPPSHVKAEAVVCIDLLDAGVGDDVIVAFGHAARVAAESEPSSHLSSTPTPTSPTASGTPTTPIDAAVVAVVDGFHIVRPGT